MSFYHFCCILIVRNESLGPAHTQGERIAQGLEYQEVGTTESPLGGCLLQAVNCSVCFPDQKSQGICCRTLSRLLCGKWILLGVPQGVEIIWREMESLGWKIRSRGLRESRQRNLQASMSCVQVSQQAVGLLMGELMYLLGLCDLQLSLRSCMEVARSPRW